MSTEHVAADDAAPLVDVDGVVTVVTARVKKRFQRRGAELTASLQRWLHRHGNGIPDDEVQGATAELVRMLAAFAKRVDEDRRALRQPLEDAIGELDMRYKALTATHPEGIAKIRTQLELYAAAKADRERQSRAERAERTSKRAEVALDTAAETGAVDDIFAALGADMRAAKARQDADASVAELSRVRGEYGGQVGLRTFWTWRVVDEGLVPRKFLMINSAMISAARVEGMKGDECTAVIPGIEFYREHTVAVR